MAHGEGADEIVDTSMETMQRVLGEMAIGETKIVGVEEFRELMHAIHSDINMSEDNSGEFEGDLGKYAYARSADDNDVTVTRLG